jgi:calcineurin-like phosphoesterase family protein
MLISNWNECIKPGDRVYHCGDFSFERNPHVTASRLNGQKYLVKGNHDKSHTMKLIAPHFEWIKDYFSLKVGKERFILFHYPIRNWHHCYKGTIHLFGHSHGGTPDMGKSTDVGVDCWDYKPVHIDTILSYMKGREHIAHHA